MAKTSGVPITTASTGELLIKDAFERIGIIPDLVTAQQYKAGIRSINLLLSDWGNKNFNCWTIKQEMLGLTPGIKSYTLPPQLLKLVQCELRTSSRQLLGAPTASAGEAINAFNDNLANNNTCNLEGDSGWIEYSYTFPTVINLIGIRMFKAGNTPYSFNITCSRGGVEEAMYYLPETIFPDDTTKWFVIPNYQPFTDYTLTQASGDEDPMFVQIYFNNNIVDITMSEVSQYNYLQYPRKEQIGRPTVYYVNYQLKPELFVWQVPSRHYNCIYLSYQQYPDKVVNGSDLIDIPPAFLYALTLGVATDLAQRYAPEKVGEIGSMYQGELQNATMKNRVNLPITLGLYGTGN